MTEPQQVGSAVNSRVVVVGGAGDMGRHCVRTAARFEGIESLVVADLDADRARSIAAGAGPAAEPLALDATDDDALRAAFSNADVVLNAMGPFARFGIPVLRAAIECGCHYLDIDDDWEPTLEALRLDGEAREGGLTAIVGLGASPGVTNLLALLAAERLHQVDELITGWTLSMAVTEREAIDDGRSASAALAHWLLQSSGTVRTWDRGAWMNPAPLQRVELDFPGVGRVATYTVGHPEAVTLPRVVDVGQRSLNVMSGPEWAFERLRNVAAEFEQGALTLDEGAARLAESYTPQAGQSDYPRLPRVWALASGERNGRHTSVAVSLRAWPRGRMGGLTGIPLALGLRLLLTGKLSARGVLAPEMAISPRDFFDELAPLVTPPHASGIDLVTVQELSNGEVSNPRLEGIRA